MEYDKVFYVTYTNICISIVFIAYIFSIAYYGASWIDGTEQKLSTYSNGKRFFAFFVCPGISIGIILFPKIFSEFTNYYRALSITGSLNFAKYIGWLFLIFSLVVMYSFTAIQ